MRDIPFRYLTKDNLIPIEEFLYERYRLNLGSITERKDLPPTLKELARKYPQIVDSFFRICRNIDNSECTEERYLRDDMDVALYSNLRYLPKPKHTHQFFEILIVLNGNCENIVQETILKLKEGDICFIAPNVPHQVLVNKHEGITYNILVRSTTFQNTFVDIYGNNDIISEFFTQNLYRYKQGTSPYILCKTDGEPIFAELMDRMIHEDQQPGKFAKRYLNLLFETFILELLRRHEEHFTIGETTDNIEYDSITTILRYIENNYQNLTLSEAARFFHYSESHLSRVIKKFTGESFSGIIQSIKLKKAVSLLMEENMTIAEIVDTIGYNDNSHFYKRFKQHYGMTPIQYKEANGK